MYSQTVDISILLGKTVTRVTGHKVGGDDITFYCDDGTKYHLYHNQDCCESVSIEDICGDIGDLIGSPILVAEEVISSQETPAGVPKPDHPDDSYTWTFYKFATIKGYVTIRWYGESNGYYSESVDFEEIKPKESSCE
jgi:hypothetical protein